MVEYYKDSADLYHAYKTNPCDETKDFSKKIDERRIEYRQMKEYSDTLKLLIEYAKIKPNAPETSRLFEELCKMRNCARNPYFIQKSFTQSQENMEHLINRGGRNAS